MPSYERKIVHELRKSSVNTEKAQNQADLTLGVKANSVHLHKKIQEVHYE